MPPSDLLTTKQAAEQLGVTPVRIIALIREGRIQAEKLGRDWVIRQDELAKFERLPPGNHKLSPAQVLEIQQLYKQGQTIKSLSKQFKVSERTIYRYIRNI